MLDNGVKTTLMQVGALLDEVVGNRAGSTVRVPLENLVAQLLETGFLAELGTDVSRLNAAQGPALSPRMFHDTDDDLAWEGMATEIEGLFADGQWSGGFGMNGGVVDLGGRTYVLDGPVHIDAPLTLCNGRIVFTESALSGEYALQLGPAPESDKNYRQVLRGVDISLPLATGASTTVNLTAPKACALLRIPRTFACVLDGVVVQAGDGANDCRYGARLGQARLWGLIVSGSRLRGGRCPLNTGNTSDHTGQTIIGSTIGQGGSMNMMVHNPNGLLIGGNNIEHSRGKSGLVVTSGTNGTGHDARGITIINNYFQDDGEATGYHEDNVSIRIGPEEVPGTLGWIEAGEYITSDGDATGIEIARNTITSPHLDRGIEVRALSGVKIHDNSWAIDNTNGTAFVDFRGAGRDFHLGVNREVTAGTFEPSYVSTTTNRVRVDRTGVDSFMPALEGSNTTGTASISARGGSWSVNKGEFQMSLHYIFSLASGFDGSLRIPLPSGITPAPGVRGGSVPLSYGFVGGVAVAFSAFPGGSYINLVRAGTSSDLTHADLPAGAANVGIQGSISFAV